MYLVHQGMLCIWQSYLSCCINDDLCNHCNHRYQVNGRRSEYYIYHIRFYWSINNLNYRYIGNPFLASCTDPENFSRRGWRDECVWKGVPPRFLEILLWELISLNFPGGSGPPDLPPPSPLSVYIIYILSKMYYYKQRFSEIQTNM